MLRSAINGVSHSGAGSMSSKVLRRTLRGRAVILAQSVGGVDSGIIASPAAGLCSKPAASWRPRASSPRPIPVDMTLLSTPVPPLLADSLDRMSDRNWAAKLDCAVSGRAPLRITFQILENILDVGLYSEAMMIYTRLCELADVRTYMRPEVYDKLFKGVLVSSGPVAARNILEDVRASCVVLSKPAAVVPLAHCLQRMYTWLLEYYIDKEEMLAAVSLADDFVTDPILAQHGLSMEKALGLRLYRLQLAELLQVNPKANPRLHHYLTTLVDVNDRIAALRHAGNWTAMLQVWCRDCRVRCLRL